MNLHESDDTPMKMSRNSSNRFRVIKCRMPWLFACGSIAVILGAPHAGGDPPPADDYTTWLQEHFPADYGNQAMESTVWGENADPDGDGCGNLVEFVMHRDPNVSDAHLGMSCRIDGEDFVTTFRETMATNHGVFWLGEWSKNFTLWTTGGVRYETVEIHTGYRVVEARVSRNRELKMFFRLVARR